MVYILCFVIQGIGLETARELVTRGATVVIACRSMVRGNVAKGTSIKKISKYKKSENIEPFM